MIYDLCGQLRYWTQKWNMYAHFGVTIRWEITAKNGIRYFKAGFPLVRLAAGKGTGIWEMFIIILYRLCMIENFSDLRKKFQYN